MGILEPKPSRSDSWITTHWSVISRLNEPEDPEWQTSWTYLVETYRGLMERYAYRLLSRIRGEKASREEAEDVVESFLGTCFEKDWLTRADPTQGRFRAYVQTLLRRYVYGHVRRETAQKRQPKGGKPVLSIHDDEAVDEQEPEVQAENADFDRSWTQVALDRAIQRLGAENERYQVVILDLVSTHGEGSKDLGDRLGLRRAQVPVLRHRARKRFQSLFEEELALTVGDEEAFREEWRFLLPYITAYGS